MQQKKKERKKTTDLIASLWRVGGRDGGNVISIKVSVAGSQRCGGSSLSLSLVPADVVVHGGPSVVFLGGECGWSLFLFLFFCRGGAILWQNLREICLIISCKSTEISAVVLTVNPIWPCWNPPFPLLWWHVYPRLDTAVVAVAFCRSAAEAGGGD